MATLQDYFRNTQLSIAAFADLYYGMLPQDYITALTNAGMSVIQAREFIGLDESNNYIFNKGYEIVSQLPNTLLGFSATVFRSRENGPTSPGRTGATY